MDPLPPRPRDPLARVPAWALGVVALALLGRLVAVSRDTPSLIAPAAGLACLWFLARRAGLLSVDALVLVVALGAVVAAARLPAAVGIALLLGILVQACVAEALARRWCTDLWGVGAGTAPLRTVPVLARLVAGLVVAGVAGGVAAYVVLLVDGAGADLLDLTLLVGRAVAGALFVVPVGLVLARGRAVRRRARSSGSTGSASPAARPAGAGPLEVVALAVATVGLYVAAFVPDGLPLAFPLLVVTAWAALRLETAPSVLHAVGVGTLAVGFTLAGRGPFVLTDDPRVGAVLVQLFVCVVVVSGLTLAVGRDERSDLLDAATRAEAAATEQSALLRAIIDAMHEGLVVVEEGGRAVLTNPAAERLDSGPDRVQVVLDAAGRLLEVDQMPMQRALAGEDVSGQFTLRTSDGRELLVELTALPLPARPGRPRQAVVVVRDVTEQELQRRELVAFAGVVAHDLKNPLTVIDGWTEVLADELEDGNAPDPATVATAVEKVGSASKRMSSLIRHLLEHATSRDAALRPEVVDLVEIVRDVARGRDATALVEVGEVPPVHADAAMLRQLMENLVGNALKYVVPGEPARVVVEGGPGELPGTVAVRVTDHGVGIPDESKDQVFQQFYRAHAADYAGTGLGLAICRRIVDRHGGTITVRDNPSARGTQVEVVLPAA